MAATAETVGRFGIFAGLPSEALSTIAGLAREKRFADGGLLFAEGAPAHYLYLILEGKVSLEKRVQLGRTGTPRRATTEIVCAWQVVGWSSLVSPFEYTSSAVCHGETVVLAIPGDGLRRLMLQQPAVGFEIISRVASLIRHRLASSTATLSYFLSVVSHELKRPMAAVEGYLQVLLGGYSGDLDEKQRRLLERCMIRLNDLRALISDILDFARMQPEQIQADFELVEPQQVGAEAMEEVRLSAEQKKIILKAGGPPQLQPIVAARRRLGQVVANLLANAVKFSPEGSTVTLLAHDEPEALVIEVLDEGIGIPQEDLPHIFDDFYRGANVEDVGGAGLGLSIAKKVVAAHQGEIIVLSPPGPGMRGSKFTVRIPRSLPLPSENRAPENPRRAGELAQEPPPLVERRPG
jgi:signal transduction histidine kinase